MTIPIAEIVRDARLRDTLDAIAEWRHASGPDRVYHRRHALACIAEFRELHLVPERRAFERAVERRAAAGLVVTRMAAAAE